MSYAELDGHPKKYDLMRTAFTLQIGLHDGKEIWKAMQEAKAKTGAN
jgi:hypothetical protein